MGVMLDWTVPRYCLGPCGREMRRIGSEDDGRPMHQGFHKCVNCRGAELRRERGIAEQTFVWYDSTHQQCSRCGRIRSLTKFGRKARARSGRNSICQQCFDLKHTYGIEFSTYMVMFESQKGHCNICKKAFVFPEDGTLPLHVDHCHVSGKVRSLLCGNCNRSLGIFRESVTIVKSAINYLANGRMVLPPDETVVSDYLDGARRCTDCHEYREFKSFGGSANGVVCRRCRHIRYRYGISFHQRRIIFGQQGGCCAICKGASDLPLHVDHDHGCCPSQDKGCGNCIRGLLCASCNLGIGITFEDKEILNEMCLYIERWTQ